MPPSASSNAPGRSRHGARERAAHVAEQRRLDELLGHGAAVEDDEGAGAPRAVAVDLLGEELLARARLALDEHRRVARGDVGQQAEELAQLRVAPRERAVALLVGGRELERLLLRRRT